MSEAIKCLCCVGPLKARAAVCPRCGLSGLDQIFQSRAAYLQWRQEVLEPYKALCWPPVRLFSGLCHVLFLQGDKLYGMRLNSAAQLGDFNAPVLHSPHLIARDVKAAGHKYSSYVTTSGCVKLIGRGKYADNPPRISNVAEVYADCDKDTFWIKDRDGRFFGFGDNDAYRLEKRKEKCLFQVPLEEHFYSYPGEQQTKDSDPNHTRRLIEAECMSTYIYQRLTTRELGYYYVDVGKFSVSRYGLGDKWGKVGLRVKAAPSIMQSNERIYAPVQTHSPPDDVPIICNSFLC